VEISDDRIEGDSDSLERVPCGDDSCIGTIGPDGRCRICGLSSPAKAATAMPVQIDSEQALAPVLEAEPRPPEPVDETVFETEEAMLESGDDDWQERVLCSDESCIGVLGADGLCRVCGKPGSIR
jgi:ferredoxin